MTDQSLATQISNKGSYRIRCAIQAVFQAYARIQSLILGSMPDAVNLHLMAPDFISIELMIPYPSAGYTDFNMLLIYITLGAIAVSSFIALGHQSTIA